MAVIANVVRHLIPTAREAVVTGSVTFIGSIPLHLLTPQGTTALLLDVAIRPQVVLISLGPRALGTLGRSELAEWLCHPSRVLWAEDVVFGVERDRITIAIDYRQPYLVPDSFVWRMLEVL